jgi:hypothetical protein
VLSSAGEHTVPRQSCDDIKLSNAERAQLLARSRCYTSRYRDVIRADGAVGKRGNGQRRDRCQARHIPPNRQRVASAFTPSTLGVVEEQPRGGRPATFFPSVMVEIKALLISP